MSQIKCFCVCVGPYPSCSHIWVKSDSWVGSDSSWLAGLLISLTVQLPCTNFSFQNLSVTWKTSIRRLENTDRSSFHNATLSCSKSLFGKSLASRAALWLTKAAQRKSRATHVFVRKPDDLLELGLQILGRSVDMVHTMEHKSPEPSDSVLTELET